MTDSPKFSIITPSFNQGRFIEETIVSVLDNGYSNVEYIIIDGGSKDETVDIIKKYEHRLAYWVSEKDKGQTDAINKGLKHVTGDIIAYMNSDDYYLPHVLEKVAAFFSANPEVDFYTGQCVFVDEFSRPANGFAELFRHEITDKTMTSTCIIAQPSTFFRKRVLDSLIDFDETLHFAMDYDFWLRGYVAGFKFSKTQEDLSAFRIYAESKTGALYHTGGFAYDFIQLYAKSRLLDKKYSNKFQHLISAAQAQVIHLLFVNLEAYKGTDFARREVLKKLGENPHAFFHKETIKLLVSVYTPSILRKLKRKIIK